MKKKIMGILMCAFMIMTSLVGCGSANDAQDAAKASATNEPAAEEKVIRVGTGGTYNPWCFKENERAGYKVEFTVSKFSGLVGLLDAGQIDTVAHQMSITKERQEKYNFTEPYAYSKYDFIVKKDSPYAKIEDMKGKKVGAWLGGNGEKTLKALNEEYDLGLDMKFYDGTPLEKEVETGRLDACWQGAIKSQTVIKDGNLDAKLMGAKTEIGSEVNAYPFAKTQEGDKMSEEIGNVIKEMHEDGTLSELSQKWFDLDTTKK